jgi:hypothetical protein
MEEAFEKFIKENWPGFSLLGPRKSLDFEDTVMKERLEEAFKAGWEAKQRDIIDRY